MHVHSCADPSPERTGGNVRTEEILKIVETHGLFLTRNHSMELEYLLHHHARVHFDIRPLYQRSQAYVGFIDHICLLEERYYQTKLRPKDEKSAS